jgi:hypothetical protein
MEECFLPNPAMGLAFKPDLTDEETHLLAESYLVCARKQSLG